MTGVAGSSSIPKEKDDNMFALLLEMRKDQKEQSKVVGELSMKVQVWEQENQRHYYLADKQTSEVRGTCQC